MAPMNASSSTDLSTLNRRWQPTSLLTLVFGGCLALFLLCTTTALAAPKRVALLVGNSQYQHERHLPNPVRDVDLLAQALRGLGFEATVLKNLDKRGMELAINRFASDSDGADTALVLFAGHGMQPSKGGRSFLLPVNARVDDDETLEADGVPADDIATKLERVSRPAKLRLVILDACRSRKSSRGNDRGLAPPKPADDYTLIAYSTRDGEIADDGPNSQHSPYALALAKQLPRMATEPVRVVFDDVMDEVLAATKTQRPNTYGTLSSRIGLDGVRLARLVPEATSPADPEHTQWTAALHANTEAAYGAYLRSYPQGQFASAARNALAALKPAGPRPAAEPAPASKLVQAPTTAPRLSAGQVVKDCAECPELVVIFAGGFTMGSPNSEAERRNDEGPQRMVHIRHQLAVGRFEVTRGQFARFVEASGYRTEAEQGTDNRPGCAVHRGKGFAYSEGANWREPGFIQTDDHPVVCVSWNDTQAYLKWLNTKVPSRGYRLLSESEWEYAARAGGDSPFPWEDSIGKGDQCKWANGADQAARAQVPSTTVHSFAPCNDGFAYTAPVGRFKANWLGLHDMFGNAFEWVQDIDHTSYEGAPVDGSAWLTKGDPSRRVARGGGWVSFSSELRSARRFKNPASSRSSVSGFRVAASV